MISTDSVPGLESFLDLIWSSSASKMVYVMELLSVESWKRRRLLSWNEERAKKQNKKKTLHWFCLCCWLILSACLAGYASVAPNSWWAPLVCCLLCAKLTDELGTGWLDDWMAAWRWPETQKWEGGLFVHAPAIAYNQLPLLNNGIIQQCLQHVNRCICLYICICAHKI